MRDIELKNKVIAYFEKQSIKYKTYPQEFTAREIAEAVGGYTGRIGIITESVIIELKQRKIKIKYVKTTNPRKFILTG